MKPQRQPSEWTCFPTSFAMMLDIPVQQVLKEIGHNGGRIADREKPFPANLEVFTHEQMYWLAHRYGFVCVSYVVRDEVDQIYNRTISGRYWRDGEIRRMMRGKTGVLSVISKQFKSVYHAVAWDGEKIYDPQEDKLQSLSSYELREFIWVFKKEVL